MRKKSIRKNYIYNLSYQFITLITPLITTPYVSRILGVDGIGKVSYIESIASYFVLFATMGMTIYGQREISYVQDDKYKRSVVFWNVKTLQFVNCIIALLIYFLISTNFNEKILYYIFSMNIVNVFFDITWFFQGLEEFGKIVIRNVFFKVLNIIYLFVAVKNQNDLLIYAFGLCFFTVISNLSLWFFLPRYIQQIRINEIKPFKRLPEVISLFVPTIAISIYTVLDKTMIGLITGQSYESGVYEQALKIIRIVLSLVTSLGTVMIPRIGYYFENKDFDQVKLLMYRAYRFVWFIGIPLCFGLIFIADNFVPSFFGPGYEKVSLLLKVLSLLFLAIGISNVTGMQYLIPTKRQNLLTLTVCIGAVVNFIFNLLFIQKYKSFGASAASVLAECTITFVQLYFIRNELNLNTIFALAKNYLLAGLGMVLIIITMNLFNCSSFLFTVLTVFVGATAYFMFLYLLKDDFFLQNIKDFLLKFKVSFK